MSGVQQTDFSLDEMNFHYFKAATGKRRDFVRFTCGIRIVEPTPPALRTSPLSVCLSLSTHIAREPAKNKGEENTERVEGRKLQKFTFSAVPSAHCFSPRTSLSLPPSLSLSQSPRRFVQSTTDDVAQICGFDLDREENNSCHEAVGVRGAADGPS